MSTIYVLFETEYAMRSSLTGLRHWNCFCPIYDIAHIAVTHIHNRPASCDTNLLDILTVNHILQKSN